MIENEVAPKLLCSGPCLRCKISRQRHW